MSFVCLPVSVSVSLSSLVSLSLSLKKNEDSLEQPFLILKINEYSDSTKHNELSLDVEEFYANIHDQQSSFTFYSKSKKRLLSDRIKTTKSSPILRSILFSDSRVMSFNLIFVSWRQKMPSAHASSVHSSSQQSFYHFVQIKNRSNSSNRFFRFPFIGPPQSYSKILKLVCMVCELNILIFFSKKIDVHRNV